MAALLQAGRSLIGAPRGLQAEYFIGEETGGVPAISGIDPSPTTERVEARWRGAAPEAFTVRWFGLLTVLRGGRYTFSTTSDDGSFLSVDGHLLVENGGRHGPLAARADVTLESGVHAVLLEFTQSGGPYTIEWQWARDGGASTPVPSWALTPFKASAWRVALARALDIVTWLLAGLALVLVAWRARQTGWTPARHPRTAALAFFVGLAILHTWPLATDPGHLTRHDNRDMILNEWIVAWVAHQAVHAPWHLFDANIFYPERHTLAFSEAMIVQSALGAPLLWLGASPVLTYNLLLLAGLALGGWSMCLVVRGWTSDWTAGLVSGAIFAFSAHTLTRIPHLQAQHVEFLPPALWSLDALLRQPRARTAVNLALWSVLQSLTSVYLLALTLFALGAGILARADAWWGRRGVPVARALGLAAGLSALVLVPFLLPYWHASVEQGLTRSLADASAYSASWQDYLTTPSRLHALLWSARFNGGTGLFPGAIGLALSAIAVLRGVAFKDPRARMCLAIGVAGLCLSFGPRMPGYAVLYTLVPVLRGIRATARFGYLVTLAVAALAGFGVVALRSLLPQPTWRVPATLLVLGVALEPLAAPLGLSRFDGIAPIYDHVPQGPGVVVAEMPFHGPRSAQFHAHYMLNSTRHWQPLVNGYSGLQPASFYRHAEGLEGFPDDRSIQMLREIGVTHVFVHRSLLAPERLDMLKMRREMRRAEGFGETELYLLTP